uniref:Uncharacterized protein n=1 Tax=Anguilla anguilla TaxID=7936 RepID=A0A0E9VVV3_ANGAN
MSSMLCATTSVSFKMFCVKVTSYELHIYNLFVTKRNFFLTQAMLTVTHMCCP